MKLPLWLRQDLPDAQALARMRLFEERHVATVCRQAQCPNSNACFSRGQATFMILGQTCTRNCRFCAVTQSPAGQLPAPDPEEPGRIAQYVKDAGLTFAVLTSVTRDDLPDQGAGHFVRTIAAIQSLCPQAQVEALIPDFQGNEECLWQLAGSGACVIAHNLETVERLSPRIRPMADYRVSLRVLAKLKDLNPGLVTKTSLLVGFGEAQAEVLSAMRDARKSNVDILTLGQYLAPSALHYPVAEFIAPKAFQQFRQIGLDMGFKTVVASPLTRSSFQAEEVYRSVCYA